MHKSLIIIAFMAKNTSAIREAKCLCGRGGGNNWSGKLEIGAFDDTALRTGQHEEYKHDCRGRFRHEIGCVGC